MFVGRALALRVRDVASHQTLARLQGGLQSACVLKTAWLQSAFRQKNLETEK